MEPYAVVETGGKQYRVQANDVLRVERLDGEAGSTVTLNTVLAVSDGTTLRIGKPEVEGATVAATVVEHIRGKKVVAYTKKRRKGFDRKRGHRQELTVLRVASIG